MAEKKQVLRIDIKGNEELIKLRQSLQQYQKQLKDLRKEHKDSENLTKSQATEFANLELNVKKTRSEFNKASKSVKGMNDSTKKGIGFVGKMTAAFTAANLATMAFTKASQAMKNAIQDSVTVFADFDIQMQKVKAISGANASEFSKLEKSAQELGRSTFFTATQVGELQMNFSKLGFSATETLDAQSAALDMATATGEDLARTATVIGSSIRGFNLDADQAGRVADVMAASFTSSALDLEKFQTSMTKVAPIAELMGVSMEATTAIMGKLSDAGIEASIAGTSLRNIFLKMGDPSSDLSQALGKTVGSGQELVAELKRLRDAGVDVEKMLAVVDQRQVAAFATMVKGVDVIESQILAFERSEGAAKAMADTVGDSLQGAMLRFNSALDGLKIVLVDQIGENLQNVVDGFASFFNNVAKIVDMKPSEEMDRQRVAAEMLAIKLKDVNLTEDGRRKIIQELQNIYPDFLDNIDSEKVSNENLSIAIKKANQELANKIVLQQHDEKVQERQEKITQRRVDLIKQEDEVVAQIQKVTEKYGLTLNDNFSLEGQVNQLLRQKPARYGRIIDPMAELSHRMADYNTIQKNIVHQEGQENELLEERDKLLKRLGITEEQFVEAAKKRDKSGSGGKTVDPSGESKITPAQQELMDAEMELRKQLLEDEQAFASGMVKTREQLNDFLLNTQILHLQDMLEIDNLEFEQRLEIMEKLAKAEGKLREKNLKETELSEKAKSELIRANIDNAMTIGSSLTQIGELIGENSAAAKAGIAVTKAASVASAIAGIIDAKRSIAKQAAGGDPFTAFGRMAVMAAAVAPLIASLMALKGDGGSGGGREATVTTFANGGLTEGGMFKGAAHANGGVKFAVGGRIHEAEGGEAIINKRSTAAFRPILSAINSYNGNGVKFAEGGLLSTGEKFAMGGELKSVQSMISGGGTQRVVLVESDVTSTQNRISALEARASF